MQTQAEQIERLLDSPVTKRDVVQLLRQQARRDIVMFAMMIGVALIVAKLYFPDWSDIVLMIALGCLAWFACLVAFNAISLLMDYKRETVRSAEVDRKAALKYAHTLIQQGMPAEEVSARVGLPLDVLVPASLKGEAYYQAYRLGKWIRLHVLRNRQ